MRQGHQADAIAEHAGLAPSLYMSQLTGGVSDLQQCGRSGRQRLWEAGVWME